MSESSGGPKISVKILRDKCTRCLSCAELCPAGAIQYDGKEMRIYQDRCIGCLACVPLCPAGAIVALADGRPLLAGSRA